MDSLPITCLQSKHSDCYSLYQADCVDFAAQCPDNTIHLSLYSPPFANLYIYSDSVCDMGNCPDDEAFFEQYKFLIRELHRITKPGRVSLVHCKNLVNYKGRDGMAGMRDFRGDIIRAHQEAGWSWHSEAVIWKDPVIEMQRTKAHGLLYKQLRADSTFSRQGMPEFLLAFRKWTKNEAEEDQVEPVTHEREDFDLNQWQSWASPVWMDIRQTNVLNVQGARDAQDEKHICPLQLDVIRRGLVLYSNPGDIVFDPYSGIGSTGFVALQEKRKFIGTELKSQYFKQACQWLNKSESESISLFD